MYWLLLPGWKPREGAAMTRTPAGLPHGPRISDHVTLGVLTSTVPAGLVDAVLADTGRQSRRQRQLPARLVVYYVIALALYAQASYGEVLRCLLEGVRRSSQCVGCAWPARPWPRPTSRRSPRRGPGSGRRR